MAVRDGLTNLYNRRYLEEVWNLLIRQNHSEDVKIAFFMIDIDYFKLFNDNYSHQDGDDVLKRVAHMLRALVRRSTDSVFRYGGEEFSILLYGTNEETSLQFAEKIIRGMSELHIPHRKSPYRRLTLSIGYCCEILTNETSPQDIMKCADEALYQAKEGGRNRYRLYGTDGLEPEKSPAN